jgi:hypothetical protein
MDKKIAILSFHKADNYGGILQIFALQKVVSDISKMKVEILDFDQEYITNLKPILPKFVNYKLYTKNVIRYFWRCYLYQTTHARKKRLRFNLFRNETLTISKRFSTKEENVAGYSTYIVGSDQIWNSKLTNGDTTLFLDFVPNESRKISYAASFGHDYLTTIEKQNIIRYIPRMNYVSVREKEAVRLTTELIDREVALVLDPTLLLEQDKWYQKFSKNEKCINSPYLLIYALEYNEQLYLIAQKVAALMKLKIVEISGPGLSRTKIKVNKKIRDAGPVEFINFFRNAGFIVTNSFHGTAFSINFNKNFLCIPHKTRRTRMDSLLELLNLENRSMESEKELSKNYNLDIKYDRANELLKEERLISYNFLEKAINESF